MRHKRKSSSTKGDFIKDEKRDGYVLDDKGKIVGEARSYDPYSHYGDIMFYEADSFGFISGYLKDNWSVMSKTDLLNDTKLRRELGRVEYEDWKKHNTPEMKQRWENYGWKRDDDFEAFCRRMYERIQKNSQNTKG